MVTTPEEALQNKILKSLGTITTSKHSTQRPQGGEKLTCYKPLVRAENTWKWEKAKDGHLYHPAKIFSSDRLENYDFSDNLGKYKYTQINCGKCIGCRLDYSRQWANRGYLESTLWQHNYFVTLTYDDDHLTIPEEMTTSEGITYTELEEYEWKGILVPKDFTQFLKDLRQEMKRKYNHVGVRFMGCGEYGDIGRRSHYHLILFNCPLPEETFYNPRVNWEKDIYYQNEVIEKCWPHGLSNICEANWNNIAYTARYITKKQNGKESEDFYAMQGEIPEFFRASNHPGIAKGYYDQHKEEIYKYDQILIQNKSGSYWVQPPRYFDRLFEKEYPDQFEEIKKKRQKRTLDQLILKGETTSLTRWEQLQIELASKELQTSSLTRKQLERSIADETKGNAGPQRQKGV